VQLFSCLIYGLASASLTFINKSIYENFDFSSPLDVIYKAYFNLTFQIVAIVDAVLYKFDHMQYLGHDEAKK
jgi:hypothetical protein